MKRTEKQQPPDQEVREQEAQQQFAKLTVSERKLAPAAT